MEYSNNTASTYKLAKTVKLCPCRYVNQQCDIKSKFKFLCKKAFTLAEVLITLTIIGVVASMTIPTLMSKYQKHTYVVGLKKVYSELSNAIKMVPISEGCSGGDLSCAGWNDLNPVDGKTFFDINGKRAYLLSKQFKVNKTCSSLFECHPKWQSAGSGFGGGFVTENGVIFTSSNGVGDILTDVDMNLMVDVNGLQGPNENNRDIFTFNVANKYQNNVAEGTILPNGSRIYATYKNDEQLYWQKTTGDTKCTTETVIANRLFTPEYTCTGRVLEEDAMNY